MSWQALSGRGWHSSFWQAQKRLPVVRVVRRFTHVPRLSKSPGETPGVVVGGVSHGLVINPGRLATSRMSRRLSLCQPHSEPQFQSEWQSLFNPGHPHAQECRTIPRQSQPSSQLISTFLSTQSQPSSQLSLNLPLISVSTSQGDIRHTPTRLAGSA